MKIEINKIGEIVVTHKVSLSEEKQRKLIKQIVTKNGYYHGDEAHDRWTVLYNAYDIIYETDIRSDHEKYCDKYFKVTRLEFLINTEQIDKLLHVTSRLYRKELEEYITHFIEE